uniref:Uncharacterized protein n=1 Tax=viral metagenome TaxID=1070528 RepID=A0A6C0H5D3_9ZZZZ
MIIFNNTNKKDKKIIFNLFKSLEYSNSYYSVLQYLYNNHLHFVTTDDSKNICTPELLNLFYNYFSDKNYYSIIVNGDIHSNYHTSNILLDQFHNPTFVKDFYIQFQLYPYDGIKRHLLVKPPNIENHRSIDNIIYYPNNQCYQQENYFIYPTV